jgi:RNA polymerase-interacting CarD/CdnL/TRCF family regulator
MQFKIGDIAVHEVYGVGRVTGIEELSWKEPLNNRYYVLTIGDAKVWVPVENETRTALRPLTPKTDLPAYRKIFTQAPAEMDLTRLGRTTYLAESKKHPTFQSLCETVRDLSSRHYKNQLGSHEVEFLERVTHQLAEEWSLSARTPLEEAKQEIQNLIMAGLDPSAQSG